MNNLKFIKNAKRYLNNMQKYINLAKYEHFVLPKLYKGVNSDKL